MIALYDMDTILYRSLFAAEHKNYILDNGALKPLFFDNKKSCNNWIKENKLNEEDCTIWTEHTVEPWENARTIITNTLDAIRSRIKPSSESFFLSGPNNFRYKIATIKPYKGNRDPSHKPVYLERARSWCVKNFGACITDGIEADDAIGIAASVRGPFSGNPGHIIVTNDKDLRQLAGQYYDFTKGSLESIGRKSATLYFYGQMLAGDPTDNIPGLEGTGPETARTILDGVSSSREAELRVYKVYAERYGSEEGYRRMVETARLVKIHTHPDEVNNLWTPRYIKLENKTGET